MRRCHHSTCLRLDFGPRYHLGHVLDVVFYLRQCNARPVCVYPSLDAGIEARVDARRAGVEWALDENDLQRNDQDVKTGRTPEAGSCDSASPV